MTVPLLPFNDLKVWGSPFHGLVKGGQLTLPNAETMSYPQPGSGDTYLVKFSGVPAVERTPAQQADDDLAGYEWRTDAIIASNQLHGRGIGSPWLHKDADGRVWQVTVSHTLGNSVTLTLAEFGVIRLEYVEPEEIVLNITLPDMGLFEVKGITLMDVRPDGNQAVFIAAQANDKAIFTITLAELAATVVVEKSLSDMTEDLSTPEVETIDPVEFVQVRSYWGATGYDGPVGDRYIDYSSSPVSGSYDITGEMGFLNPSYGNGRETREQTVSEERFFWANYDASGGLHFYSTIYSREDYYDYEVVGSTSGSWTAQGYHNTAGSMTGSLFIDQTYTTTERQTYTYQLCRDSTVLDEYEIILEQVEELIRNQHFRDQEPVWNLVSDPYLVETSGPPSPDFSDTETKIAEYNGEGLDAELEINYGSSYYTSTEAKLFESLSLDLPSFEVIQSTNKLVHMIVTLNYNPGYQIGYHIGPDNADSTRTDVTDLDAIDATYHPITGQIVREQSETVSFV
jgi:hypothetical protein